MQATRQPTAVETILKSKLADVKKQHTELMEAVKSMSEQVMRTEEQVNSLVTAESYTAKNALILAMDVDELLDTLTTCHRAVSDGLNVSKTQMLNMPASQHGPNCEADRSTEKSNIMDNNTAAVDVLNVQMEVLQQQVSSLQESQEQTTVTMLGNKQYSSDTDFHLRLQNVEAKLLLLQDVQVRDDTTVQNAVGELSSLRIDVMSLQDDIMNIKSHQSILEGKTEEVKNKTDDLVRLQQILNGLHTNVAQREELTIKLNELQDNVSTINVILNPFTAEINDSNPNVIVISDDNSETEDENVIFPSWQY